MKKVINSFGSFKVNPEYLVQSLESKPGESPDWRLFSFHEQSRAFEEFIYHISLRLRSPERVDNL